MADRRIAIHCCVISAFFALELFCLTSRFDRSAFFDRNEWWAVLILFSPDLLRIALVAAVSGLFFGGVEVFKQVVRGINATREWFAVRWSFAAAHFIAMLGFAAISFVVFDCSLADYSSVPGVWILGWYALGACTLFLWALAVLSLRSWGELALRGWQSLAIGVVLAISAWAAGWAAQRFLWQPLGQYTSTVALALLLPGFPDAFYDPSDLELGTPSFSVTIAPQCSGYEGVGLMLVFLVGYLRIFRNRLRFPAALWLIPLGIATVWLLNCVRIAALVAVGASGWPDIATGGFHSQVGWLFFIAAALGLVMLSQRVAWFAVQAPPVGDATHGRPDRTFAYLMPLFIILLATILGSAFSVGLDWLYPLRFFAAALTLWCYRANYRELLMPSAIWAPILGGAVAVAWMLLAPDSYTSNSADLAELHAWPTSWVTLWVVIRLTAHVITVPLAEELAFRGYLIRRLMARDFESVHPQSISWTACAVSSILFGALHGRLWLAASLTGLLFALALRRRGQLIDAVIAHATANAMLAALALYHGQLLL